MIVPIPTAPRKPADDPFSEFAERTAIRAAEIALERAAELLSREPLPTLLTSDQLARELGVSTVHIRKLVRAEMLPHVMVGDCRRFSLAEVIAALRGAK